MLRTIFCVSRVFYPCILSLTLSLTSIVQSAHTHNKHSEIYEKRLSDEHESERKQDDRSWNVFWETLRRRRGEWHCRIICVRWPSTKRRIGWILRWKTVAQSRASTGQDSVCILESDLGSKLTTGIHGSVLWIHTFRASTSSNHRSESTEKSRWCGVVVYGTYATERFDQRVQSLYWCQSTLQCETQWQCVCTFDCKDVAFGNSSYCGQHQFRSCTSFWDA